MDKFCDIRVVSMVNYFALPTSSLDCRIVGDNLKVVIRDEGLYAGMPVLEVVLLTTIILIVILKL